MPGRNLYMLRDAGGDIVCDDDGNLSLVSLADDHCMWEISGTSLVSITSGLSLETGARLEPGDQVRVDSQTLVVDGALSLQTGPTWMPSEHLAELQAHGFTVLEHIMDAAEIARLKAGALRQQAIQAPDEGTTDGRIGVGFILAWSPEAARAVTHPVALWLMQQYLGTNHIHYCHPPGVTMMRPAKELLGTFPEQGWHSDYPYHPGVFPQDRWADDPVFGLQFNICVDEFRPDNAATQYLPGSHKLRRWPPIEFNTGGTRMGQGVHKDVAQMVAPAGAALIYDSRTWHRACDELNVSGENRFAILNAVAPSWVLPMTGKRHTSKLYSTSAVAAQLTRRERADIHRLCNEPTTPAPVGAPEIQRRVLPPGAPETQRRQAP